MKAVKFGLASLAIIMSAQSSHACSDTEAFAPVVGLMMMMTITSAPTGTTLVSTSGCRDVALALREEAFQARLTGFKSEMLQTKLDAAATKFNMTEDQVIQSLIDLKAE